MTFQWTAEVVEELKTLHEKGVAYSEIARRLGCGSRNAVIGKVHRMGWERRGPRGPSTCGVTIPKPQKKAVQRRYKPKPVHPAKEIDGHHITILELAEGMCRWPVGDPLEDDFHFCGNETREGSSYCAGHHSLAYRPYTGQRKDQGRDWDVDRHKRFEM